MGHTSGAGGRDLQCGVLAIRKNVVLTAKLSTLKASIHHRLKEGLKVRVKIGTKYLCS